MNRSPGRCKETLSSISAYLDGELDKTACDAIEQHCRECRPCAAFVKSLRETVGLCRQAGSVPLPKVVRDRARERVRRLLDRKSAIKRPIK